MSSAFFSACGGGGSSTSTASQATVSPSAEGAYSGTLTGSSSNAFEMVVLENGDFWALYGSQTPTQFGVAGFIKGTGTYNNGSFTSSNAKDFGFASAASASISATYEATAKTISGSLTETAGTTHFSGGPIQGSTYNYDTGATLSTVAGSWDMISLDGQPITLNISSSGTFSTTGECFFSGSITPRPSGKNIFNVSFLFSPSYCPPPPGYASSHIAFIANGVAIAYPLANGKTQLVVASDLGGSYGFAAFGIR